MAPDKTLPKAINMRMPKTKYANFFTVTTRRFLSLQPAWCAQPRSSRQHVGNGAFGRCTEIAKVGTQKEGVTAKSYMNVQNIAARWLIVLTQLPPEHKYWRPDDPGSPEQSGTALAKDKQWCLSCTTPGLKA